MNSRLLGIHTDYGDGDRHLRRAAVSRHRSFGTDPRLRREMGPQEVAPGHRHGRQDLEMLPCYEFKDSEKCAGGGGPGDCAVCLESFQAGDRCRMLPLCRHSFHAQCLDSWLLKSSICPICRANVSKSGTPPVDEQGEYRDAVGLELGQNPSIVVGFPAGASPPPPVHASTSG